MGKSQDNLWFGIVFYLSIHRQLVRIRLAMLHETKWFCWLVYLLFNCVKHLFCRLQKFHFGTESATIFKRKLANRTTKL
jgi:hypothetical protein